MAEVRSDSRICVRKGKIKTVILESDYEELGYKDSGWDIVEEDWTRDRKVKPPVDYSNESSIAKMAEPLKK